jgi:hypothetical protein
VAAKKFSSSTPYQRRNQRAQALGYRNYYDYRVHNHGKSPASAARPRGESLARLRGHRSSADLRREAAEGTLMIVVASARGKDGQYKWVDVNVVDHRGRERVYRLRGAQLKRAKLNGLIGELSARGVSVSPSPSIDLRRYVSEAA